VSYGQDSLPGLDEPSSGGNVKYQHLAQRFPSSPADFSLLYLGSSGLPRDLRPQLWAARRRGAPVVLNPDGVGYRARAGDAWEAQNRPLRLVLAAAEHVLYQSAFCKEEADAYLGEPRSTWEILRNAVDIERFKPSPLPSGAPSTVLLAGDQTSPGRFELGVQAFSLVLREHPDARLVVTGRLPDGAAALVAAQGVGKSIELVGRYSQAEAPALYQRAHVLLHTKVLDPCPNVVLEALATGVPVVHPASGGTPELVGDAGIAVTHVIDHERLSRPTPEAMAAAVVEALRGRERLSELARARAVEHFPLDRWLDRHATLFGEILARRPAR
jgi:glycosyltransferase involved in cell wall biosynthesis